METQKTHPPQKKPAKKAWVKQIIYKPVLFRDDLDDAKGTVNVGVCIFLGGERDEPATYPQYNWHQRYYTFTDGDSACPVKHWNKDPCPRPTDHDDPSHTLYRPDPEDQLLFTDRNPIVKTSWKTQYLFRDLPRRKVSATFTGGPLQFWIASTTFVGVPQNGPPVPLVKDISYGFEVNGPYLTLLPLKFGNDEVIPIYTYDLREMKPTIAKRNTQDPCVAIKNFADPTKTLPPALNVPATQRFRWTKYLMKSGKN